MLGKRIRELRSKRGLTVRQFAEILGKSPAYVSKIEARGEIPSAELLCIIANSLETDLDELLRLAKKSQLDRTAKDIDQKQAAALALFRKHKR
jgi:XRE family transcriptional regulator, fatty acid utilization regulator